MVRRNRRQCGDLRSADPFAASHAGAAFLCARLYVISQKYEPVLEVGLDADASTAARLGWLIGNLHFPLEVAGSIVRVADDPALRQLFAREHIAFTACMRVFHPLGGGHHH